MNISCSFRSLFQVERFSFNLAKAFIWENDKKNILMKFIVKSRDSLWWFSNQILLYFPPNSEKKSLACRSFGISTRMTLQFWGMLTKTSILQIILFIACFHQTPTLHPHFDLVWNDWAKFFHASWWHENFDINLTAKRVVSDEDSWRGFIKTTPSKLSSKYHLLLFIAVQHFTVERKKFNFLL